MTDAGLAFVGFPFILVLLGSLAWVSHKIVTFLPISPFKVFIWEERIFWGLFALALFVPAILFRLGELYCDLGG